MVKPVPVLGTLVLLGAIVQIVFGFQVAADIEAFLESTFCLESSD